MRSTKVLIVPNAEISKSDTCYTIEKNTGEFALELQNLGFNVSFFGQFVEEVNNIHVFELEQNCLRTRGLRRRSSKVINYLLLHLNIIPEILRADFIYIFYPSSFMYVGFLCKLFGKKYGLYVRGSDDMIGKIPSLLYKNSFVVFTVADYFSQNINNIVHSVRAHTIRPMIDLDASHINRARCYVEKNYYKILYLGRMTNDKGIIELLNAVAELQKGHFRFHLNLVGDGEYNNELKKIAKRLNILELVSFKGATFDSKEIKRYFEEADLFILPSYHEGFPRTLYEAMIYGTPIITTFVGGVSSIMKNNNNCIEIKAKSVVSIVDSLEWCFSNYSKFALLAKNATKTVDTILSDRKYSHAEDLSNAIIEIRK